MADHLDLIVLGHPPVGEIRARAFYDLSRSRVRFPGDVDLVVRPAVRGRRSVVAAMDYAVRLEQVVLAALQADVISSRAAIRSVRFSRPVVEGIEYMAVSFTSSNDRLLVI